MSKSETSYNKPTFKRQHDITTIKKYPVTSKYGNQTKPSVQHTSKGEETPNSDNMQPARRPRGNRYAGPANRVLKNKKTTKKRTSAKKTKKRTSDKKPTKKRTSAKKTTKKRKNAKNITL